MMYRSSLICVWWCFLLSSLCQQSSLSKFFDNDIHMSKVFAQGERTHLEEPKRLKIRSICKVFGSCHPWPRMFFEGIIVTWQVVGLLVQNLGVFFTFFFGVVFGLVRYDYILFDFILSTIPKSMSCLSILSVLRENINVNSKLWKRMQPTRLVKLYLVDFFSNTIWLSGLWWKLPDPSSFRHKLSWFSCSWWCLCLYSNPYQFLVNLLNAISNGIEVSTCC